MPFRENATVQTLPRCPVNVALCMPVAVAISTGEADDLAKSIAEIFVDPIGTAVAPAVQ